jgi:hypothetical protein
LDKNLNVGYCGVCCDHCGMKTRIPRMAEEFKRFVKAYKYGEWISYITQDFEFENFMKGINWFANSNCLGCLKGGGMPTCEIRNCCKQKSIENCYFCKDFLKCDKLGYQRETYRINENYERIRQIGYERWLREQEEKSKADFDNIWYLEKKKSK